MASPSTSPTTETPSLHPMRVGNFRRFWIGATISLFGDQFYLVALP